MWRITLLSLLVAGAGAQMPSGERDLGPAGAMEPSAKQMIATLEKWHKPAAPTHLRGELWEVNRRIQSSKRHLTEKMKEDAKKTSILSHRDAQSIFVQEQVEQRRMDLLAGRPARVTGSMHSNPEDTPLGVLREPSFEGAGEIEEPMERYNEAQDAQADFDQQTADDLGVEPELVPIENVDGEGWIVDDNIEYRKAIDDAVATHRHETVKFGRMVQHTDQKIRMAKYVKEKESEEDANQALHLMRADGYEGEGIDAGKDVEKNMDNERKEQ